MPYAMANGLSYHISTAGTGPVLLLLHGFTGSAAVWQPLLPALSCTHRCIAPDLLGHGASPAPLDPARYDMDHCVADLAALLDTLGEEACDLVGYSMGGRVALAFACTHQVRVRRLVLESASPGLGDAPERLARAEADDALATTIERAGLAAFVDLWEQLPLFANQQHLPAAARAALRAQRLANSPHGLANSLRGLGTGRQAPLWRLLPALRVPVLLIAGALDAKFVSIAHAMHAVLPSSQLHVAAGAGHTVHVEQPATFAQAVQAFLAEGAC